MVKNRALFVCWVFAITLQVRLCSATGRRWSIIAPKHGPKLKGNRLLESYVLSDNVKQAIVDGHNYARSNVNPPASNMRKISWDNDLEEIAKNYAKKCQFTINSAKYLSRFRRVEELQFISEGIEFVDDYSSINATYFWDAEKRYFNYKTAKCQSGKTCDRYTQMAWADTFRVGCGISKCSAVMVHGQKWNDVTLMVCDYVPGGNWINSQPYKLGKICSQCHSNDTCEDNLCSNPGREVLIPPKPRWSEWTTWSSCSKTCGWGGVSKRSRWCNTFVNKDCGGNSRGTKYFCSRSSCSRYFAPQPKSNWSRWGPYSACTATCGGGRKVKTRTCKSGNINDCRGSSRLYIRCNGRPCPKWNPWREWARCSSICDGGIRVRTRACNSGKDSDCDGSAKEEGECNKKPCPTRALTFDGSGSGEGP